MRHPWQQFVDVLLVPRAVWAVESMSHPSQQFVDVLLVPRAVWAVESMCHPSQQFVSVLWVPSGCLGCWTHASPVTAVCRWFLSPYGLFGLSNQCVRDSRSLIIVESLRDVWAVETMRHMWQQSFDDFWVLKGCLGCRIHASPVTAVR